MFNEYFYDNYYDGDYYVKRNILYYNHINPHNDIINETKIANDISCMKS